MPDELQQLPERQDSNLTRAQQLTAFAFENFDTETNESELRQAAEELNSAIMHFWAQAQNGGKENPDEKGDYTWSSFQFPNRGHIAGSIVFEDNSELEVLINIHEAKDGEEPSSMADVELSAGFADEDPGVHPLHPLPEDYVWPQEELSESQYSQLWSVHYSIASDGSRVKARNDMSWGKEKEYNDKLDKLGWEFYDDEENERIADIETMLINEGVDPDTNLEVAAHRSSSEGYRLYSDHKREEAAKESFHNAIGHSDTRDVGVEEVRKVIAIFGVTDN